MDKTNLIKHPFNGLRIQAESKLTFDEVLRRLREATGNAPLEELNTIATAELPEEEFERQITERYVGKSGFMIFMEIDHGKWITRYGINRRVLRVILGNPLIAITMLKHDITAGLFAPIELLLVEHDTVPGCSLYYVQPSSLMVIEPNEKLANAAKRLDAKAEQLILDITGMTH